MYGNVFTGFHLTIKKKNLNIFWYTNADLLNGLAWEMLCVTGL